LFHHDGTRYASVVPDAQGRRAIPELDLEVALLDGWVRFWFRRELLPLPGELQRQLDETRRELSEANRRNEESTRQLTEANRRSNEMSKQLTATEDELARLRSELERLRSAGS